MDFIRYEGKLKTVPYNPYKVQFSQFSLRPDEVHSSGRKLVYNYTQGSVPARNYLFTSKDSYNYETLLDARKLEKLEMQHAKSRIVRIFNLGCLANKVTLKTLQIKWNSKMFEQAIIIKADMFNHLQ